MPEAVVVSAVRSPIGRARKGSLVDIRADEVLTQMVESAINALPGFDPAEVDDLLVDSSAPVGEAFHNIARVVAVLAGLDTVPATTVNRYCSSSVQTTRMAMHAIRAGEGKVFISAGVESVSRTARGLPDGDLRSPRFAAARARSAATHRDGPVWHDPREDGELPDVYIGMGLTAENVARLHDVTREEQDSFAARSQHRTEAAGGVGHRRVCQ